MGVRREAEGMETDGRTLEDGFALTDTLVKSSFKSSGGMGQSLETAL